MRFFRPSVGVLLFPLIVVVLSFVDSFLLREFVYHPLSTPFQSLIDHWGLEYRDKPFFLDPRAAQLTAALWAPLLYIFACAIRWIGQKWVGRKPGGEITQTG